MQEPFLEAQAKLAVVQAPVVESNSMRQVQEQILVCSMQLTQHLQRLWLMLQQKGLRQYSQQLIKEFVERRWEEEEEERREEEPVELVQGQRLKRLSQLP